MASKQTKLTHTITIDGFIYRPDQEMIDERAFIDTLLAWLESKGYVFGGLIGSKERVEGEP